MSNFKNLPFNEYSGMDTDKLIDEARRIKASNPENFHHVFSVNKFLASKGFRPMSMQEQAVIDYELSHTECPVCKGAGYLYPLGMETMCIRCDTTGKVHISTVS